MNDLSKDLEQVLSAIDWYWGSPFALNDPLGGVGGSLEMGPTVPDRSPGAAAGATLARFTGSLLRLEAKDRCHPRVLTVSFDVKNFSAVPNGSTHMPRLRITWGSSRGGGDVFVDARHGLRLSLECAFLNVDGLYLFQGSDVAADNGPNIRIIASVGVDSVGDQRATLTEASEVSAAPGAGAFIQVPSYARALEVQSSADPTIGAPNTFTIGFFRGSAGGVRIGTYAVRDTPITIPNGTETIQITNAGPGAATYTPIWHLTI